MATYRDIQARVKATHGFVPKTCWIADIKARHGLTRSQAPNRYHPLRREHPCPPAKRAAVEAALSHFAMI
ncbi:hypothetical protein WG901_08210 [Novosphingobium sp. PS1R-30]|uniref:RNA methyltransferase n=1 Tax=Novosphingobium anseongense TaxID=3133436 RepID=A0ABU8RUF7_9SPHN